jgi:hypothetical protein
MAHISVSASLVTAGLISSTVWNWMSVVLENTPVTNMQIVSTRLVATTASANKDMRAMAITASVSKLSLSFFSYFERTVVIIASS